MALTVPDTRIHEAFSHYYLPKLTLRQCTAPDQGTCTAQREQQPENEEEEPADADAAVPCEEFIVSLAPDAQRFHLARLPLAGKSMLDVDADRLAEALLQLKVEMKAASLPRSVASSGITPATSVSLPLVSELTLGDNPDLSHDKIYKVLEALLEVDPIVLARLETLSVERCGLPESSLERGEKLQRLLWRVAGRAPCLRQLRLDRLPEGATPSEGRLQLEAAVEMNRYPAPLKHIAMASYDDISEINSAALGQLLTRPDDLGPPRYLEVPDFEGVSPRLELSLGDAAMTVLSNSLLHNQTITRVDLSSNNLGDSGAEAIAQCLRTNTTLTELSLDSNHIGTKGGLALLRALEGVDPQGHQRQEAQLGRANRSLTELNLNDNNLTDPVASEILRIVNERTTTVGYIGLTRNCISPALFSRLSEGLMLSTQPGLLRELVPYLYANNADYTRVVFNRSEHKLTDVSTRVLLHALRNNTVVSHMDLSNNELTDDSAVFLSQILEQCPIRRLILQTNYFTDEGAKKLLCAAPTCPTLELLDIRFQDTPISSTILGQVEALVEAHRHPSAFAMRSLQLVENSPDVTSLHLDTFDGKRRCSNQTVGLLRRIFEDHNTHVTELYLGNNTGFLTDLALDHLATLVHRLTVLDLCNLGLNDTVFMGHLIPSLGNSDCALTTLGLDRNPITDATVGMIVGILRNHNGTLVNVTVEGCKDVTRGAHAELRYCCDLNSQVPSFKALVLRVEAGEDLNLTHITLKATDRTVDGATSYQLDRRYDDVSCRLLCRAMETNAIVTHIDLTGNEISDESSGLLAELILSNITLTHLNVSYNRLTDAGLSTIGRALQKNSTLTVFVFDGNRAAPSTVRLLNNSTTSNVKAGGAVKSAAQPVYSTLRHREKPASMSEEEHANHVDRIIESAIFEDAMADRQRFAAKERPID